tara:strand:+ start:114 stop:326 length:213 start_codon:yes stop_codon:yes gene_type:complete
MGFSAKQTIVKGVKQKESKAPSTTILDLSEKELEFLLVTIKNGLFKGEYVELCYDVTLKIQNQYNALKDK